MKSYRCCICGNITQYEDALPEVYPFCSERCRMVDLGQWLSGAYTLERELTEEEIADINVSHAGRQMPAPPPDSHVDE